MFFCGDERSKLLSLARIEPQSSSLYANPYAGDQIYYQMISAGKERK